MGVRPARVATAVGEDMNYRSAVLGAMIGLVAFGQLLNAAEYIGSVVHIADGDTFDMDVGSARMRVRFCGMDSPERGHEGYREAKTALTTLISEKTVRCVQVASG